MEQGCFWEGRGEQEIGLGQSGSPRCSRKIVFVEELEARKEAKGDYKKWALMEEISWR